ncbi:hypothetical protein C0993_012730 [Termitomyces sp. T159_Od127]|nr:hypothetical protein C0993_012730 [Termitomyces sp. T159_Od127]
MPRQRLLTPQPPSSITPTPTPTHRVDLQSLPLQHSNFNENAKIFSNELWMKSVSAWKTKIAITSKLSSLKSLAYRPNISMNFPRPLISIIILWIALIYCVRTKLRVIADPRLSLQNTQLSNQLHEERAKVDLLTTQLRQVQNDQVRTAWMARGIFDGFVEQSNAEFGSVQAQAIQASQASSKILSDTAAQRDDALQRLEQLSQEQDCLKQEYERRLHEALTERQTLEERQQQELDRLQQDLQDQERHFQQEQHAIAAQNTTVIQRRLEEHDRAHEQTLKDEIERLQAEHQQQIMEYTQANEERMKAQTEAQFEVKTFILILI